MAGKTIVERARVSAGRHQYRLSAESGGIRRTGNSARTPPRPIPRVQSTSGHTTSIHFLPTLLSVCLPLPLSAGSLCVSHLIVSRVICWHSRQAGTRNWHLGARLGQLVEGSRLLNRYTAAKRIEAEPAESGVIVAGAQFERKLVDTQEAEGRILRLRLHATISCCLLFEPPLSSSCGNRVEKNK